MNQSDIFSGVTAFVRAAESHSFTQSARLLGVTPSAVSKAVSRLEKDIGVRLFHRSPREVTLTAEGFSFFNRCKSLVHDMEDARALVESIGSAPQGLLRICAPVTFGEYVLAPALSGFLDQNPGLRIDLVLTDRFPDWVEERFDMAIRVGEVPDSRLIAKTIYSRPFVTAASPQYLALHGRPTSPTTLSEHNCLGYLLESRGVTRTWIFEKAKERWVVQPTGSVTSGHASVLLELARKGLGIIHTPFYLVTDALRRGELIQILEDYQTLGQPLSVVYPQSRFGSAKLDAFIHFLFALPLTLKP